MKLGLGIHGGILLNNKLLELAGQHRDRGVGHWCYANAAVDTIAVAKGDEAAIQAWAVRVGEQLSALAALGMSVGARPLPMILEQIEEKEFDHAGVLLRSAKTPNFIARNTSLTAAKALLPYLGDGHGIAVQHEWHDTSNRLIRTWAVKEIGPAAILYAGFQGLWIKYGGDFGSDDLPHTVHVALNRAGAGDASAPDEFPGPADCTPKDIRTAAEKFAGRLRLLLGSDLRARRFKRHVHINVLYGTPVAVMKEMLAAAAVGCNPDVLMLRSVFGANDPNGNEGDTLKDPATGKHVVSPNSLEAIEGCAKWMT